MIDDWMNTWLVPSYLNDEKIEYILTYVPEAEFFDSIESAFEEAMLRDAEAAEALLNSVLEYSPYG